jgi:hypothetical protein
MGASRGTKSVVLHRGLKKLVTWRLEPNLLEQLKAKAAYERVTMTSLVEKAIRNSLECNNE